MTGSRTEPSTASPAPSENTVPDAEKEISVPPSPSSTSQSHRRFSWAEWIATFIAVLALIRLARVGTASPASSSENIVPDMEKRPTESKSIPLLTVIPLIVSTLALMISGANIYFSFFWYPENLKVYFRFTKPDQVGTSTLLDLGYYFSNNGKAAILIVNIGIYELWTKAPQPLSGVTAAAQLSICEDTSVLPVKSVVLSWGSPEQRRLPYTLKNGGEAIVLNPDEIFIDGSAAKVATTLVEAGKAKGITATFKTQMLDTTKYDIPIQPRQVLQLLREGGVFGWRLPA